LRRGNACLKSIYRRTKTLIWRVRRENAVILVDIRLVINNVIGNLISILLLINLRDSRTGLEMIFLLINNLFQPVIVPPNPFHTPIIINPLPLPTTHTQHNFQPSNKFLPCLIPFQLIFPLQFQ
jgi:hypothetical protein